MLGRVFAYLSIYMVIALLLSDAEANSPRTSPGDLSSVITGKWAWADKQNGCAEEAHHILFSADGKRAHFRTLKPFEYKGKMISEYSYTVLYQEGNRITMLLDNEDRRTQFGDRAIWVLILATPDIYRWRRTDWAPDMATPDVKRCK